MNSLSFPWLVGERRDNFVWIFHAHFLINIKDRYIQIIIALLGILVHFTG